MAKPTLISGIQPTGKLHLGNYLGALKNFVELQNSGKYNCYFFVADLHSLTEGPNPNTVDTASSFLAAGLDPKRSVIFQQSQSPEHTELAWILGTMTPMGELRRMTQFKEKSDNEKESANVGLFYYPVLMAVDILFCDSKFVPVGEDQLQHLELTRTLARKFNAKFGKTFVEPQPLLTEVPRLMSLDDATKKMSKSRPAGCLFLDDSPNEIREKIKRAVTDSGSEIKYDLESKPAISNLMLVYSTLSEKPLKDVENKFKNKTYSEFKSDLSEVVIRALVPFQEAKRKLKPAAVKKILIDGSKKADAVASKKLEEVKKKIGLTI